MVDQTFNPMEIINRSSAWWGPPRKFSTRIEERKVSWMEGIVLRPGICDRYFHYHPSPGRTSRNHGFTRLYLFFHHDLLGMVKRQPPPRFARNRRFSHTGNDHVADDDRGGPALAITINTAGEDLLRHATIALMVMQVYITYMWWSVGIYDKAHRRLNGPYTVLYLSSFVIMLITLFMQQPFLIRILFFITLILNYIPPFIVHLIYRYVSHEFDLSPGILKGWAFLPSLCSGKSWRGGEPRQPASPAAGFSGLVRFGLAIIIVLTLWWLFFTTSSDRNAKADLSTAGGCSLSTSHTYVPGTDGRVFVPCLKTQDPDGFCLDYYGI